MARWTWPSWSPPTPTGWSPRRRCSRTAWCSPCPGVTPRLVSEGGEMDGIIALVAAGLGAAVIPELVVRPDDDIVARPFARPGLSRTIEIAQRAGRPLSRAAQAMATALDAHAVATATT